MKTDDYQEGPGLYTRAYLVDTQGRLIGKRTPRTPRKIKKRLKKTGQYNPSAMVGFALNDLLQ